MGLNSIDEEQLMYSLQLTAVQGVVSLLDGEFL